MKYEEHKSTKRTYRTQAGAPALLLLGLYALSTLAVWIVLYSRGVA